MIFTFIFLSFFLIGQNYEPIINLDTSFKFSRSHSDEFSNQSLDTNKWDNDIEDWGMWSWTPENVRTDSGKLFLTMTFDEHKRGKMPLSYKSGAVRLKNKPVLYGYFESKIKGSDIKQGVCPAFWAFKKTDTLWTEIDVIELTSSENKIIDVGSIVFRHPLKKNKAKLMFKHKESINFNPNKSYNIYSCKWEENSIEYYINGQLICKTQNKYFHQPLDIILSFGLREPFKTSPQNHKFPTEFTIEYVRVWEKSSP